MTYHPNETPEPLAQEQAGEMPTLPKPTSWQVAVIRCDEDGDTIVGWRDEFSETSFNFSRLPKRTMFTAQQMLEYATAALQAKDEEIARLKADAGRYQWLCKIYGETQLPCMLEPAMGDYIADGKASLDVAIDAMKGEAP